MVRDHDEVGGGDPSLCLLLGQRALSGHGLRYTSTELPDRALLTRRFEWTLVCGVWAGHSVAVAFEAPFLTVSAQVLGIARIDVGVAQRDQNVDEMLLAAAGAVKDARRRGLGKFKSSFQSCASGWSR